jgi:hypothetical protein
MFDALQMKKEKSHYTPYILSLDLLANKIESDEQERDPLEQKEVEMYALNRQQAPSSCCQEKEREC